MANENLNTQALKQLQKAELISLKNEHKKLIVAMQENQKDELAEAKAQGMEKAEIHKLKNELFYENIDKKNFDLMLFKKKLQRPNTNYPKCNPDSLVKDYAKSFFCLVEKEETKKEENNKSAEDKAILSLETAEVNPSSNNSNSKDINSGKNEETNGRKRIRSSNYR